MKLYNEDNALSLVMSQESFKDYYRTATVISTEALSDYLYKVKDMVSTFSSSLTDLSKDKIVIDFTSTRFETEHVAKRLNYTNFKHNTVQKPENFKGKYIDYTEDLIKVSEAVIEDTYKSLSNLKLSVSSFINEYSENKANSLYGYTYFKDTEKLIDKNTKAISSYFPKKDSSTKANVEDILRNLSDIPTLYIKLNEISNIVNEERLNEISRMTKDVILLVDSLIDQNKSTGILLKTERTKKELIESLHIVGTEIEFLSYLYSNIVYLYSSFKSLSELILEEGSK